VAGRFGFDEPSQILGHVLGAQIRAALPGRLDLLRGVTHVLASLLVLRPRGRPNQTRLVDYKKPCEQGSYFDQ